jgi:hypothetical protein
MKAKITHMFDNWEYYFANSVFECRDDIDKFAYETLWDIICNVNQSEKAVQVGKVCIERV